MNERSETMSETRVRLLLAKWHDEDALTTVIAAIDQTVWDHWDDETEADWVESGRSLFGADPTDYEVRQAWAVMPTGELAAAFAEPEVEATVET